MQGYSADKAKVVARLKRVEGQVRALSQMVEDDAYCIDVLTQISASTSALKSVAQILLDDHLQHCIKQAVEQGGDVADEKVAEASAAIARLVKS
ncbi:metal-sensitive transcriptional regulator [Bifidobacterium tsurumiense]|uniref:Copper-sensing transcriptional repressor CsoR n=1 Tax=Bifidobacterium tsurumiense TaxID=356829 RepID=A0A087EI03_9BIFI|nr:metal-sensitive transcriptional regulator [Bifidobacterium tsurumiense]KFJ07404.1 copper-sensing transcriptional repressor CsoR [Bifidobacterium tsurumiense]MDY4677397.1 metal-sensitive transcriptional regulator [Bifidobacterium tsurumiense]MSS13162.1 metal-sensitive transcriptional regulator [Bifidobacterium tsurumiense]